MGLSTVFFVVIVLCLLRWWKQIRNYWKYRSVMTKFADSLPGPTPLPIIGNALWLREADKTAHILTKISRDEKTGTYRFWMGPSLKIIISDPRDLEIMFFSTKASKKDDFYDFMHMAVKNGLINSFGPIYRAHKKLLIHVMNNHELRKTSVEKINEKSRIFVNRLETKVNQSEFNIQNYLEHCIGDIVFETIFGLPGNAQNGEVSPFFELAEVALHASFERFMKPWLWPDFIFLTTPTGRRCKKILTDAKTWIDQEVEKKRQRLRSMEDIKENHSSIFDSVISRIEKTNEWTNEEIRDEVITFYVGGHDTMVGTGCFALLMLAMFPDVQEKAREEIKNVAGDGEITESQTAEMKYLDMTIKETLRLFPVGCVIARKTTDELKLATCTVPKDCSLFILLYATQRDPKHWQNPEVFDPEHFSPENVRNRHPFAFNPFSAGYRSCPGNKFAFTCLKIIFAHILRNFRLSSSLKFENLRIHTHISSKSLDGYPISVRRI
ncbi:cytochrome P450 4C1 [Fopius arisanus]|uniref:Cytochrome P450 4C1 n=2 Tax=Fopius arisanus TaxID=64838 RepID=A0A9R1TK44_9HYME|nr:PREDICTED: cytochrome P450 4C1-like [Fopius arisanus]